MTGSSRGPGVGCGPACLAVAAIVVLWVLFAAWAHRLQADYQSNLERVLAGQCNVVGEHVTGIFRTTETFLAAANRWVIDHPLRDPGRDPAFLALASEFQRVNHESMMVGLIKADGEVVLIAPDVGASPANVADRDYFVAALHEPPGTISISAPIRGRSSGRWVIVVATRLSRASHGVVMAVVAIEQSVFNSAFDRARLGADGSISLVRRDGVLLARSATDSGELGKDLSQSVVFTEGLAYGKEGLIFSEGHLTDGVPKLISYAALDRYPLVVTAGVASHAIPRATQGTIVGAAGVVVLISVLIVAVARQFGRIRQQSSAAKAAVNALNERERHLRTVIDLVPHFIFAKDFHGYFTLANRAVAAVYGTTPEGLLGKSDRDFNADVEQVAHFVADDQEVICSGKEKWIPEEVITDAEGRTRYLQTTKIPYQGLDSDVPSVLGVAIDITDRKRDEQALKSSEQRFREIFDSVEDAILIHDADSGRILDVNRRMLEMYALSYERALASAPDDLSAGRPPYSAAEVAERFRRVVGEGPQHFEWHARDGNGRLFWVEVRMRLAQLDQQAHVLAVVRDITARKKGEEKLRLAATILATSVEGVVITDADGRIQSVNRAFTEITGYAQDEVLGRNPRLLRSGRHEPEFYQTMWTSLLEAGVWQGEISNRRRNGEVYPEWLTITAIRGDDGALTHYVGVFSDISSLKRSQESLERLAHFDPLTDLPNRTLFQDRLAHAIDRAKRYEHLVAVLLLDLDGFKTVNDSLGHPVGDRLLQEVARRLHACIRVEDTVSRMGGDEFALILVNMKEGGDAIEVVAKILNSIQEPLDLEGHSARVTASIGIAIYPADGESAIDLVRNADTAMYGAKEAGRNAYRFYRSAMTHRAQERLTEERALRRGIERDEFEVWFQPQFSLRSGVMTGAEALVRWRDPRQGLVLPAEFIKLAESTGLVVPLGKRVLEQVCHHARRWLDAGLVFGRLAVNVAVPQIDRSDFVDTLHTVLQQSGVPSTCIEIEITESLIMENAACARAILLAIQALGVNISIDDFGTGYSSLAYLKQLPINKLKIDRHFVRDLPGDVSDAAITRAIIFMAHSLGFQVVAEGIESEEQQDYLNALGCDEAQGYHLGPPLPADRFESWLWTQLPEPTGE